MFVAIMGYGVVGSGVAALLKCNRETISRRTGKNETVDIKYILDLRDFPGDENEKLIIHDFSIIENDPEVGIVVETMGGLHPAYEFVLACLKAGKSVATSNKELVAEKGCELLRVAAENNVNFMFEASVGGGIPVIRPITRCLSANEIYEVAGILNGTTNFILTKMFSENVSFESALAEAQKLGYAEKDPSADVDGIDALRKICILASLCFGNHVYPRGIHTEGIRNIKPEDVEYARQMDSVIKLIASASKDSSGKINILVSPAIIKNGGPMASTGGVFNAVLVRGNAVGDVVFYGRGAGDMPTASAVVADIIDCALHSDVTKRFGWEDEIPGQVAPYSGFTAPFYVRAQGNREITEKVFGNAAEFISAGAGELVFRTQPMPVSELEAKLSETGCKILSVIRITDY